MNYNIKAKKTFYNNIYFRSLLEARWAKFFDDIGWKYEYEPYEINGRLPDFILYCNDSSAYESKQIIVEVKPSIFITDEFKKDILNSYKNEKYHLLILNESPFYIGENDTICIGLHSQYYEPGCHTELYDAEMKTDYDFGSGYMCFDGLMGLCKHRKSFIHKYDTKETKSLLSKWRNAQNKLQFNSY